MIEGIRTLYNHVDRGFRRADGPWARAARKISPLKGEDYLKSDHKRKLDLAAGIPLAIAAAPVIAISASIKALEDGANPFFIQDRLVDREKTFKVVKIRTMVPGAEKIKMDTEIRQSDDKRVTGWGRFLRKHHIDEAPQLFQVLTGEMTLVGPRPIIWRTVEYFQKHWPKSRFDEEMDSYEHTKKGVTGLDQIMGNGRRENGNRYILQKFYRQKASLGFDLYILWRTIKKVIRN